MKSILIIFAIFNVVCTKIIGEYLIPDEFKDAKDALESDYYKETLDKIFEGKKIPIITIGGRIAGGEIAEIGQFPYHALLYMTDRKNKKYVCGGVLIKYNFVLTAAHCIEGFSGIEIFLGVIDRNYGPVAWRSGLITNKKFLITHPQFDKFFLKNDIGLIYLADADEGILVHQHIGIINIPTFDEGEIDLTGMESVLSGFGITEDGSASKVLKFAELKIISNEECIKEFPAYIMSSNLCTATSVRASPCQGDSGGPLTVEIFPNRRIVIGLTSFGSKYGCTLDYPVVFQRISNHLIWLNAIFAETLNSSSILRINLKLFMMILSSHIVFFKTLIQNLKFGHYL